VGIYGVCFETVDLYDIDSPIAIIQVCFRRKQYNEPGKEIDMNSQFIVFTDLDGTLLDYYTYSFEASIEGIELLKSHRIPLIFCTSKSYAEVIYFREKTGNTSPFIVENGGAIYLPPEQFEQFNRLKPLKQHEHVDGYSALELGASYDRIRQVFKEMKKEFHDKLTGFGDMSVGEVSRYLNLEPSLAAMAKVRRHDEPFILKDPSLLESIKQFSQQNGLKIYPGTRFYHLMGNTDKGVAVKELVSLYRTVYLAITAAAIGEGKNDEPMFRQVDMPFLVKKPDNSFTDVALNHIIKIDGIGPYGFTLAVKALLAEA
jgi:mannosyl-3-phosphoglycerate phosphatase